MDNFASSQTQPLILVADDDRITRQLIVRIMEQEGYRVTQAANGEECLAAYQQQPPDMILLDAMMPVMDGFDCCRQLKKLTKHQSSPLLNQIPTAPPEELEEEPLLTQSLFLLASVERTPILMITGLEDEDSVERAFEVGATDFVTKPINWPVLRQRVRRLIQQSRLYRQLEAANLELQRLATLDGLTQLANRRHFDMYLQQEWRRSRREQLPLSLILADIDFFKRYNDTYGHQAGDVCLQKVADLIARGARGPADLAARYGGEELAVILPNTNLDGAVEVAQQVQEQLRRAALPHEGSPLNFVSLSLGVASLVPTQESSPPLLITQADEALYEAKKQGRDRVVAKMKVLSVFPS